MDHAQDVERLFSWLKAPMVQYREFAPRAELAEAVSTWPAVHRTAVETGVAAVGPAPQGDAAARERAARERRTMPPAAAQAIRESPLSDPAASAPTPGRLEDRPAEDELSPPPVQHVRAPEPGPAARPAEPPRDAAEPAARGREAARPYPEEPPEDAAFYPGREREGLFAGEYRGRERERRPSRRVADRQDRSLDAVFTRLSGARDRLPDPRERARTSPGLGSVFGRLR